MTFARTQLSPAATAALLVLLLAGAAACQERPAARGGAAAARATGHALARPRCAPDDGGLQLAPGLCAAVVAELPGARHLAVAPNGDVYVALTGSRGAGGGVAALRDADEDGKAEVERRFGGVPGSGIALHGGYLYFAPNDAVLRWKLPPGGLEPTTSPDTIVQGLPTGGHTAKTIALDDKGNLYVNIGSRTNSCQQADRVQESPGLDPCRELETRAGIWRFRAGRLHQTQAEGERFATGIRNAVALTVDPQGQVWALQHGRDQLFQSWPRFYDARQGAELPAEELLRVHKGDDFGWPYCYYDGARKRLVLAPEYGGDGVKVGRCAGKKAPVHAFPGHWAPEAIVYARGSALPGSGAGATGVFIAFHGSWNRAPEPQATGRVVFLPLSGDKAGAPLTVADGFAGPGGEQAPRYKPMGLALARDGSLFIGSDQGGRIWRLLRK